MKSAVRFLAWPFLLASSAMILIAGFAAGQEVLYFNVSYLWIVAWLYLLEKNLPYSESWRDSDGQIFADLGHTFLNKGLVQVIVITLLSFGTVARNPDTLLGHQPMLVQVIFALIASEMGLYWAHRIAHKWPLMWRFHAIHHSVKKLWFVNTGRFHFVDSQWSVLASVPFLLLTGLSMDAIIWVSAITAYIGILTHCNVDMRCGWLNYIFNTPNLHRWHHSTEHAISDNNYGENLMLWDQVFGTYLYKPNEQIGVIGISDKMPSRLLGQLWVPFIWKKYQAGESVT